MEIAIVGLSGETGAREREAAVERLLALGEAAYRLAARVVGSREAAEDAVQQAYLEALATVRAGFSPREERSWFLKIVANAARKHLRGETRRRRREAAVERERERAQAPGAGLVSALGGALAMLEEKYRLPVALCCEEGLSRREAAAVLDIPERTLSDRIRAGLDRLRRALERAGYPAAVAATLGGLKQTAPNVPASLTERLAALAARGAGAQAAAGVLTGAALKGGLAVKIVAGVVLAGAVATGVAVSTGGLGSNGRPLPTEKPKFSIPVWHPDAEWKVDKRPWAGVSEGVTPGVLDGPRREIMWRRTMNAGLFSGLTTGCRYVALSYEARNERYYTSAGSARGYLDGPFGRARFGGIDYSHRARFAASPDGRYVYFTEPYYKGVVRVMDFEKQEVRTFWKPEGWMKGPMVADSAGRLYAVRRKGKLYVFNPDGKVEKELALDMQETFGGLSASIALDEKRGRLYGAGYGMKKWYVFYWDVKDGSFHGVLPIPQKGEPSRGKPRPGAGLPGPFKGTALYGEGDVAFGPDDPEKNFLYTGRVDTRIFFRLDLKKEFISPCSREKDGTVRFIDKGKPGSGTGYGRTPRAWLPDGSFLHAAQSRGGGLALYRRVK